MIDWASTLDRHFFIFLNSFHSDLLNPIMEILSGQIVWIPFVGFFLWYAFRHLSRKEIYLFILFLIMAIIASDVTSSYIIKNIVNRLRPCREIDLKPIIYSFGQKCGGKFGFVSSHAANSLVLIIFSVRSLQLPKVISVALLLIPILVGYSRIYLGVHYPGDILGGFLVALIWGYFFSWAFKHSRR